MDDAEARLRRTGARMLTLTGAVLAALVCPTSAHAQLTPCDPSTTPMVEFQGLPDQIIQGRKHPFGFTTVSETYAYGRPDSDLQVTMAEQGHLVPFFTGTIGRDETLHVRSDLGDAPLTITATFSESWLGRYPAPSVSCQRTIAKTVTVLAGRPVKRPTVTAGSRNARFELATNPGDDGCLGTYEPSPIAVQVKRKGARRWVTAATPDQCVGFVHDSRRGPGFELDPDVGAGALLFEPDTTVRNSVKDFTFRVMDATVADSGAVTVHGSPLRRGTLRVSTRHHPARRVYRFHKDGRINDAYWNYCINKGKQTYMHNGELYCVRPGWTNRTVSLRR